MSSLPCALRSHNFFLFSPSLCHYHQEEMKALNNGKGAIGFVCSLGFLLFVFKFNEYVQAYKARKNIRKGMKVD